VSSRARRVRASGPDGWLWLPRRPECVRCPVRTVRTRFRYRRGSVFAGSSPCAGHNRSITHPFTSISARAATIACPIRDVSPPSAQGVCGQCSLPDRRRRQFAPGRASWRKEPAGDQSIPHVEPLRSLGGLGAAIPRLGRGVAVQMLMRAHMVVPGAELDQLAAQIVETSDRDTIQMLLEGAKEPLDPAILPGAMQIGGLQAHAEQNQCATHQTRVEARFIVHANSLGQTETSTRDNQFTQDRRTAFVCQRTQTQTRPRLP